MAGAGGQGGARPMGGMGQDMRRPQYAKGPMMSQASAPQQYTQGQNIYDQSAQSMTGAQNAAAGAATYQPQTLAGTNLSPYQNPYQQQVIDTTLADLNRSNQMALNNVGANATSVGAFGGSRHGVAEAETNRAYLDQVARTSAGLNSQGFQNAQQGAMFDIGTGMAGQGINLQGAGQLGNLASQGFGMGQAIGDAQMRDGTIQQGVQQAVIDAARGQFQNWAAAPGQSLQYPLAAIGAVPYGQSTSQSQNPGLFNYLSLGLGLL